MRRRLIDHVWMEEVTVTNHRHEHSEMRVALEVDTDFADLFEVKDGVVAEREVSCRHDDGALTLAYKRVGFQRSLTIAASRRRRSPVRASPTRCGSRPASSGRPPSPSRRTQHSRGSPSYGASRVAAWRS